MTRIILGTFLSILINNCWSAEGHQTGKITNLTATTHGILIKLNKGLPSNCEGTPFGWMLIRQENTALISVVLATWISGQSTGTVYTSGTANSTGYCIVNQFDPDN
ncbi:hypothetical protein [Marinagarivorans algicola]|uniref:hypothetical protein n=1 Tax=Marinagarivorans algicola TaxID=1513270 RepID=UPI0006B9B508|nr:hypothetical protein [Marinagarivorans algicola]